MTRHIGGGAALRVDDTHPWYWEGNVQARIAAYLIAQGWDLLHAADTATRQHGKDLFLGRDEDQLSIVIKGCPSKLHAHGEKQGTPKSTHPSRQARTWFAEAILKTLEDQVAEPGAAVAVGLPDMPPYRRLLARTATALHRLGIGIYVVCEDGRVQTYEAIAAEITGLDGRVIAVMEQRDALRAEREHLTATAVPVQGQKGTSRYKSPTNPAHLFFVAFRRAYKNTGLTQKEVSATCKAAGIDQRDQSPANLERAHSALVKAGLIAASA
jgi:PAS domain-containing protein